MANATVTTARPAVTVEEITDPTLADEGIELLDLEAVQLPPQRLRARRVTVRLDDATVVLHEVSTRVRTRTRAVAGQFAYVTFGSRTTGTANGVPVRADLLLAAEPGFQVQFVADPGWQGITFLLPPAYIGAHLSARQRGEEFRLPRGVEMLQSDAASVQRLHGWGRRLVDAAVAEPAAFDDSPERRAAAQVELIETLLAALWGAADRAPDRKALAGQEQGRIVRIAEDHALAHVGERLYVSDLCRAAGASERALEYAFKQTMGLTPVAYLARLRLHRVRDALQAPVRGARTVSSIALDWGFWHFGEFSRAYRDCFGELPSKTLRRQPQPQPEPRPQP